MIRVCERNIIFPCVSRPSTCPSHILTLNRWAEFNRTWFRTSPHDKGVREQLYFSVRLASVHVSVALSPHKLKLAK